MLYNIIVHKVYKIALYVSDDIGLNYLAFKPFCLPVDL